MSSLKKRSRKLTALILVAMMLLSLISLSTPPSRAMVNDKEHYKNVWRQKNIFRLIPLEYSSKDASKPLGVWSGINKADNLHSGDPTSDILAIPRLEGSIYYVYSADQLRYAMLNFENNEYIKIMRDLDFGGKNWEPIEIGENISQDPANPIMKVEKALQLNGNDKTLYNFYSSPTKQTKTGFADAGFVTELTAYNQSNKYYDEWYYHIIKNLTFKNIKCDSAVSARESGAASPFIAFERGEITNVGIEDGLFRTTDRWAYGFAFLQRYMVNSDDKSGPVTIKNCYTKNVVTLAEGGRSAKETEYACASSFLGGGVNFDQSGEFDPKLGALIQNCYAVGNTVISLKGHSGGFSTCTYGKMEIRECFSDVTVLGGDLSGAFQGPLHDGDFYFTDCYSLGSVDGDNVVGGFAAGFELIHNDNWRRSGNFQQAWFKRCYSAAIVGMQENGTCIGSFMGAPLFFPNGSYTHGTLNGLHFKDCYAVGETGGIGSITRDAYGNVVNASSSVGGFMGQDNYRDGITGGLFPAENGQRTFENCYYDKQTTATREWSTGTKLENTSTHPVKGVLTTNIDSGTKSWSHGLAGGAPPSPYVSGFSGFSDNMWVFRKDYYPQLAVFANADSRWGRHTDLVKAYSEASASTVFLQPWKNITDNKTYDTVRDLTLQFELTSNTGIRWDVIADPYGYGDKDSVSLEYINGKWTGINRKPGITWIEVTVTRNAGQTSEVQGKRRLRLIPIASLEAGKDEEWKVGELQAHYDNVLMLYSDAENLMQKKWFEDGYPLYPQHYFKDADARDNSRISVTGTPINETTVNSSNQVNTTIANLPFNDRYPYDDDPDGWRQVFTRAKTIENKHGGIFLLDYKWTLKDQRYLQDYKQVTIKKQARATLEVRDQTNTLVTNAMYLNLDQTALDAFTFNKTGGLVGQLEDFPVPAGTSMVFAWLPGNESTIVERVTVEIGSQKSELPNPKIGDSFTQNVIGYKDLRLAAERYFYMTVVRNTIRREIKDLNGAMVISFKGTETYSGTDFLDFEDDVKVVVYIKGDRFVTLNIRQQVLDPLPPKLKPLAAGIYRLHNVKPNLPDVYDAVAALPIASKSSIPSDPDAQKVFQAYSLPLPFDKLAYRVEHIVPQYFTYAGYLTSITYAGHTGTPNASPVILADFTNTDEIWMTVYLRAKDNNPTNHTTFLTPNPFPALPTLPSAP